MNGVAPEILNRELPPQPIIAALGAINLSWSTLDEQVSSVIFGVTKISDVELRILLGRIELPQKIAKLFNILKHQKDSRLSVVRSLQTQANESRRDRNALVHGVYLGQSNRGEYLFGTPVDILFEKNEETAYGMRVFTPPKILEHLKTIVEMIQILPAHFDFAELQKLPSAQFRILEKDRLNPLQ